MVFSKFVAVLFLSGDVMLILGESHSALMDIIGGGGEEVILEEN